MRFLFRKVMPFGETEGLKGSIAPAEHSVGVALKQQGESPPGSANIDCLPQAIQHQDMLVQHRTHIRFTCPQTTQPVWECQRGANRENGLRCTVTLLRSDGAGTGALRAPVDPCFLEGMQVAA